MVITHSIFISLLLGAVVFDLQARRIPNWLTLPGTVLGLLLAFIFFGTHGLIDHAIGALITGGVWFIFWQMGAAGGGDQKLMLMVGAFLGQQASLVALLVIALCGGIQAIITVVWFSIRQRRSFWRKDTWRIVALPYSVSIAFGGVLTLVFGQLGFFR